jgi:hypothetical protein
LCASWLSLAIVRMAGIVFAQAEKHQGKTAAPQRLWDCGSPCAMLCGRDGLQVQVGVGVTGVLTTDMPRHRTRMCAGRGRVGCKVQLLCDLAYRQGCGDLCMVPLAEQGAHGCLVLAFDVASVLQQVYCCKAGN